MKVSAFFFFFLFFLPEFYCTPFINWTWQQKKELGENLGQIQVTSTPHKGKGGAPWGQVVGLVGPTATSGFMQDFFLFPKPFNFHGLVRWPWWLQNESTFMTFHCEVVAISHVLSEKIQKLKSLLKFTVSLQKLEEFRIFALSIHYIKSKLVLIKYSRYAY